VKYRIVKHGEIQDSTLQPFKKMKGRVERLRNRRIGVAKTEHGEFLVRIKRLTTNRKVSVLDFGLSGEAARALLVALYDAVCADVKAAPPMTLAQSAARLHEKYGDALAKMDDKEGGK
jgi:hypothetical protein